MEYPRQMFRHPGPYGLAHQSYRVDPAADEAEEKSMLARGWHRTLEEALGEKPKKAAKVNPPDQDGDGKPGGSKKQEGEDIADLRAEYEKLHGKKPFNGWDADELRKRIAEAGE